MVNPRSLALLNASPRLLTSGNSSVLLKASAYVFHVSLAGTPNTASIVFTAVPLSMDSAVTYSFGIAGGALSAVSGNTATLDYTAMSADTATVTVTATWRGQTFTDSTKITKLFDVEAGDSNASLTPAELKAKLENQITESELYADLRNRISLVDGPNTLAGSVSAKVKAETDARVAALTQEASARTTYVQQYAFSKAEVDNSLSIQANTITSAYTAYTDAAKSAAISTASADVRNYSYSKSNTDSAIAATANTLRSEFATNNGASIAWVQDYAYSKATVDSSIASTANTLRSEFAANNGVSVAYLENYAYSKSGTDSAISSATSTLSTTVGQHTTTLQTQATSLNGLSAQYTVKIDNNGYVTGYGLASAIVNGTPTSSFIINADRFAVVAPGIAPKVMFAVGNVAGQSTIGINGNTVLDGTLQVRKADGTPILTLGGLQPGFEAPGTKNSELAPSIPVTVALVGRGALVTGNSVTKTLGTTAWDADCYSRDPLYGGARAAVTVVAGEVAVGLNSDPLNDAHFTSIDFCINAAANGTLYIYENGTFVGSFGTFTLPVVLEVAYDGSRVYYRKNGVPIYDRAATAGLTLYFDSALGSTNSKLEGIQFTPLSDVSVGVAAKAAADAANGSIATFNTALNAKLNATGNQILTGPIALQDAGAIVIGTTDNGTVMSATGFATRYQGQTKFTLPIAGNPTFGGEFTAPSGTLGKISLPASGEISGGNFVTKNPANEWPATATGAGFQLGNGALRLGNFNDGKYVFLGYDGNIIAPGFQLINGQLTLTSPIILSPQYSGFSVSAGGSEIYGAATGKVVNLGSRTATLVGAGNFKSIQWLLSDVTGGTLVLQNATSTTVTVISQVVNNPGNVYGTLTAIVTGIDGRTVTDSVPVHGEHL
jgi:hypothetical protein